MNFFLRHCGHEAKTKMLGPSEECWFVFFFWLYGEVTVGLQHFLEDVNRR